MKAIVLTQYGSSNVLQLQEVEKPTPKDDEVLIKVHATSVNDWDWCLMRGTQFYIRLLCGLIKPKIGIPGVEIAGRVEGVGKNITKFKPGDAVYGDTSECGFDRSIKMISNNKKTGGEYIDTRNLLSTLIYTKIIAIALLYGATVHLGNTIGLTGTPLLSTPRLWRLMDILLLIFGVITAIALWWGLVWSIWLLFRGILLLQVVPYTLLRCRRRFAT